MIAVRRFCGYIVTAAVIVTVSPAAGDPTVVTLPEAITEARANNPTLKSLQETILAVHAGRWGDALPGNPEFFVEHEGIPSGGALSAFSDRRVGVSQEIAFPTVYAYRKRSAAAGENAARYDYALSGNEIARDVKTLYYRILMLKARRELYEETAALSRRVLRMAEVKSAAGESTVLVTLRAKVDVAEVENNILAVEKELEYSLYALKQMLGRPRQEPVDVAGTLEFAPVDIDMNRLKQSAIDHHPLLRRALVEHEARKLDEKIAWAELIPSLSLSWFRQRIDDGPGDAWGGEVGLSLPVWSLWTQRGRIAAAGHSAQAAGWQIEREKRHVLMEVEHAANRVVIARDTIVNYQHNMLTEVGELVRIAERQYEEGEAGYLELAESMRTMQRANVKYQEMLCEYLIALADLELAVGRPVVNGQ